VPEILGTAVQLYGRYPILFILLAAIVVVPYDVVVLLVTNASPLDQESVSASQILILGLIDFALVGPLVSAFQVQALLPLSDAEAPTLSTVVSRGLQVLPVVMAAEIIAGIGIAIGFLAFIIPGVYLAIRWAVVAQVAAVEHTDWPTALRRAGALARGNYLRILGVLLFVALVDLALTDGGAALVGTGNDAAQVVAGIVIAVLARSFAALTTAILYFDLRAREHNR